MEVAFGKKVFELREVVGRVVRSERLAGTTTIHTPAHTAPDGGSRPASTVSVTKIHEDIQMVLKDGSPFTLNLWNTGLMASEDDVLHTLWLRRKGKEEEVLVAVHDRTTGQEVWLDANLNRLFNLTEPMWKGLAVAFALGVVGYIILSSIPVLGTLAILLPVGLPVFTWWLDKRGRGHVAELKRLGGEGFRSRRQEAFA